MNKKFFNYKSLIPRTNIYIYIYIYKEKEKLKPRWWSPCCLCALSSTTTAIDDCRQLARPFTGWWCSPIGKPNRMSPFLSLFVVLYMFEFTIVVNGFDLCCIVICVCLWICAKSKARICAFVWVACGIVPLVIILILLYLNLLYTYGLFGFVLVFSFFG